MTGDGSSRIYTSSCTLETSKKQYIVFLNGSNVQQLRKKTLVSVSTVFYNLDLSLHLLERTRTIVYGVVLVFFTFVGRGPSLCLQLLSYEYLTGIDCALASL